MASKKKIDKTQVKASSSLAKSDDGTIQITFTIPYKKIAQAQDETLKELASNAEIPGFRKGKAPIGKVKEKIPQTTLTEKTLSKILPKLTADIIEEHKIKPAIYPKFELLKAEEGQDWQIRASTCEFPKVNLGDYKSKISGKARSQAIWTPEKDTDEKKEPTREEKENEVIKALLESIKIQVPKILIEQEVNLRLGRLLERIEKLGLTLESYLASINKTADGLRKEYENQSLQTISLELILTKIADSESIKVEEKQIDSAIQAASGDPSLKESLNTPEQRRAIETVLRRRAVLDSLVSLL